jgi:ABC-2 type transport system ATP-binding protein
VVSGLTAAVETRGLTKRFGAHVAVDHVSIRVPADTIFGLLGSNGAGKSTVMKMLTTLLPIDEGEARVADADVARESARVRSRIGYVPQMVSADGALTGRENLRLSARLYDVPRAERTRRIEEAIAFMGLGEAADRMVRTYSGGMVRRLELAQALLHRPRVLFLDEPTIGLDPVARHAVWDRLRSMRGELGMTVVLTTHDMEEAQALCDTIAILHAGRVAVAGRPADLCRDLSPTATLDDVFERHCGGAIAEGGRFADLRARRTTAGRLG